MPNGLNLQPTEEDILKEQERFPGLSRDVAIGNVLERQKQTPEQIGQIEGLITPPTAPTSPLEASTTEIAIPEPTEPNEALGPQNEEEVFLQKLADKNPELADRVMDVLGFTKEELEPEVKGIFDEPTDEERTRDFLKQKYGISDLDFGFQPEKTLRELTTEIMGQTGLGDIRDRISNITREVEVLENERNQKVTEINENPWLTEGLRQSKVGKIQDQYEGKINARVSRLRLEEGLLDDTRLEVRFATEQALSLQKERRETGQKFLEKILERSEKEAEARKKLTEAGEELEETTIGGFRVLRGAETGKVVSTRQVEEQLQFVSGTENQQAGYFNKTTGLFAPLRGGVGSGGGGAGGTGQVLSDVEKAAQDIFSGVSFQKLSDISTAKNLRSRVSERLTELKKEALEKGDLVGIMRASAGGKETDAEFNKSFEKALNTLGQLVDLQESFTNARTFVSPITGEKIKVKEKTGPIIGIWRSNNPYDKKAQLIKAQLTAVVPNLARGIYGEVGVLTDNDVKLYSQTLPNLKSTEDVRNLVLATTIRSIQRSIENKIKVQAGLGRDMSGVVGIYNDVKATADQLTNEIAGTSIQQKPVVTKITTPAGELDLSQFESQ